MNDTKKNLQAQKQNEHLVKSSSSGQIQGYFAKILELKNSGKEFPVNLDDVWRLAYDRKDSAVKELKSNFVENEDFLLRQNAEQKKGRGGHNKVEYFLSVPCLEYFIAKRIKPVFEVYRQIFHKTIENATPALISQFASRPKNIPFAHKMGNIVTSSIITDDDVIFTFLSPLLRYIGRNDSGSAIKSFGEGNAIKVPFGKSFRWYVNMQFVDRLFAERAINVESHKMACIYNDVFGTEKSPNDIYVYKYTYEQMHLVLAELNRSPVSKSRVTEMLLKGGTV